jgi:membrane protein DedA with SNARE-associated domain
LDTIVSKSATGYLRQMTFSMKDELVPSKGAKSTHPWTEMTSLELLRQNGLPLVLSTIAAGQAGAPAPSATLLMLSAAFSRELQMSPWSLLLWVTATIVLVDHLWFWLGRTKGVQVLAWLEQFSPASSAAVGAVKRLNRRHGVLLLLGAKFLPGVHALVVPASAAMKLSYAKFLVFSTLGTALWAGVYVGLGVALGPLVQQIALFAASSVQWVALAAIITAAVFAVLKIAKVSATARARKTTDRIDFGLGKVAHS